MDKPKKEPIALRHRQDHKLCLNCGFPNRPSDTHCMFCHASIVEDQGLLSWLRQTYYVLRWRLQLKQKRENLDHNAQKKLFRFFGYFLIGLMLTLAGGYFFYTSLADHSIFNGLIATLLLLYGFVTFKSLFSSK